MPLYSSLSCPCRFIRPLFLHFHALINLHKYVQALRTPRKSFNRVMGIPHTGRAPFQCKFYQMLARLSINNIQKMFSSREDNQHRVPISRGKKVNESARKNSGIFRYLVHAVSLKCASSVNSIQTFRTNLELYLQETAK